ncbi:hypothetical protein CI102_1207 [Trichoderma harzianum]|nr:hypothetical protein CI102_1207 [Trichoderma harzianum]
MEPASASGSSSHEAKRRTAPSLPDCTNVFIITSSSEPALCKIPTNLVVDPFRQKRLHHKSKRGCDQCRKRRVKCDERVPRCSACTRRQEPCSCWIPGSRRREVERSQEILAVDQVPRSVSQQLELVSDEVVNMLHMKLFHNFQHQTIPTLLFDSGAWETAMQLSFSFPSLMHAILCASARQLSFLFPDEQKYATAATTHLIKTLCLFRDDLSSELTPSNVDAFMVTTALLHMEMWSNVECVVFGPDGAMSYDPLQDRVFQHSLGVLHVFLSCTPLSLQVSSPLMPHIRHSSRNVLVNAAKLSRKSLENFRWFFSYERPLSPSLLSVPLPFVRESDLAPEDFWAVEIPKLAEIGPSKSKEAGYSLKGYYGIVDRLCLILSFLPEAQDEEYEGLSPELTTNLSRYLIIFPVLCDQQFVSMVRHGDPHAMVLLYHFYRAVRILVPSTEHWWAQRRARLAEKAIQQWLFRECARNGASV